MRRIVSFALLPIGLMACDSQESLDLPILSSDTTLVRDFSAVAVCNDSVPGSYVARLAWSTQERLIGEQRLDATVYKTGFEHEMYTTLWPIDRGRSFREGPGQLPDRPDRRTLLLTATRMSQRDGAVSVELTDLQPGLTYSWRVLTLFDDGWVPSARGRSATPVCPYPERTIVR